VHCSTRVIGVVLTGMLDDGTAGMQAIKRCGGLGIVQDPREAEFSSMPQSALLYGKPDHVAPLEAIAGLLAELAGTLCPPPVEPPENLRFEALISALELSMDPNEQQQQIGRLAPLTCPECHGAMYEIEEGGFLRYRCHTGHAFTAKVLRAEQAEAWERSLYNALRAQEEQLALVRRMADEARRAGAAYSAEDLERRAKSYEEGAEIIRRLLAAGQEGGGGREKVPEASEG
jgi:two-component system chemotaxis response regulator CheB